MISSQTIAQLDQVSYQYPNRSSFALRNLSLDIHRSEFVGIIGPTGAGKTTLCLSLNGIVPQFFGGRFFGHITVAGLDTVDHPTHVLARHVAEVFENPETQIITTSVENEVAFSLENYGLPPDEIRSRIQVVLAAVRLAGQEKKHPADLSGGQKQRLAIAAALAARPALLVLDEPTSQLDPIGADEVFDILTALNQEYGITVVIATHAVEELADHASRIIMLDHGELAADGQPQEILGHLGLLEQSRLQPPQITRIYSLMGLPAPLPVRLSEGLQLLSRIRPKIPSQPLEPDSTAAKSEVLLSVDNLNFSYPDGTKALQGVSLDIRAGEFVLIAGQNGAGKTTLVKHFLGLLQPTTGRVLLQGQEPAQMSTALLTRRIGYIGQNPDQQLFCATTAAEIGFALKNLGHSPTEISNRVEECLSELGLEEFRDRHPLSLPRGDRARVVIAAVLALQPKVLILDEPTTGQDPEGSSRILEVTRRLHRAGSTVIVITHHLHLMPGYAERMIVMGHGKILLDDRLRQAYHQVELLRTTFLKPPQAVLLAQALHCPLLTPEEFGAQYEVVD